MYAVGVKLYVKKQEVTILNISGDDYKIGMEGTNHWFLVDETIIKNNYYLTKEDAYKAEVKRINKEIEKLTSKISLLKDKADEYRILCSPLLNYLSLNGWVHTGCDELGNIYTKEDSDIEVTVPGSSFYNYYVLDEDSEKNFENEEDVVKHLKEFYGG